MVMNEVQMNEFLGANKGDSGKESTGICSLHQAPIVSGLCMQSGRELLNRIVTGGNKRRALRTQGKGPREEGRLGAGGPPGLRLLHPPVLPPLLKLPPWPPFSAQAGPCPELSLGKRGTKSPRNSANLSTEEEGKENQFSY